MRDGVVGNTEDSGSFVGGSNPPPSAMAEPLFTLLLDMDGVIADFDDHYWNQCLAAELEFDIDHPSKQTKRWFTDHVRKDHQKKARALTHGQGWYRSLPVVPGSQEGVEALFQAGVDVWLCTKPLENNPWCRDEKYAWVMEHFPHLGRKLIITPDKRKIRGDILLDDAPKIEWCEDPNTEWTPVIYSRPFNGKGSEWEEFPHYSWDQDIEILIGIGQLAAFLV